MQALAPLLGWLVPLGHASHSIDALDAVKEPAAHPTQIEEEERVANVPGAHALHSLAPNEDV